MEIKINNRIWSTLYLEYGPGHVQQTIPIPGEQGKQIRIDKISLKLCTANSRSAASALVTCETAGKEQNLAEWPESSVLPAYVLKKANPAFLAPVGAGVTLRFHLKTGNAAYRAYMSEIVCEYSLVDIEPPAIVLIHCNSESDAKKLAGEMRTAGKESTILKRV